MVISDYSWLLEASKYSYGILGLLGIPFILSILGEFISNKDFSLALKSGTAAWINYLVNTLLQLAVSVYCIYTAFNSL
ncbi:MAG: DUF456 domain-containing protein [Bacteroides sp.]|nr:DUF456 domain-containing protein [Bacteroides sp.]